ncbi:MAG: IgGFc-binding protein, partial [Flavobacteriales bacterium]|nr:IgGFc-binding protein [Flavobacteriales bacterium]
AGVPFNLTLDAGEVYTLAALGTDLTGTTIEALAPIAVFAGANQTLVGNCGASSHLYEQLPPLEYWGDIFAFVPYAEKDGDFIKFLASFDGTEIYTDCDELFATLNAGESLEVIVDTPELFTSNFPILMAQMVTGLECGGATGDPNLVFVPPVTEANGQVSIQMIEALDDQDLIDPFNPIFPTYWVNAVMLTDQTDLFTINGSAPATTWTIYDANPALSHTTIEVPSFTNLLEISAQGAPFQINAYGFSQYDAYTWWPGSNTFLEVPPAESQPIDLGEDIIACSSDEVILEVESNGAQVLWSTDETTDSITPTESGVYSVVVSSACSEATDDIEVTFLDSPNAILPNEYQLCEESTVTLEILTDTENTVSWNNDDQGSNLEVSEPGTYTATVSNDIGCTTELETQVLLTDLPDLTFTESATACDNQIVTLEASSTNGTVFWENQETNTLEVNTSGNYAVSSVNDCGTETGTSIVTISPSPSISIAGPETICTDETVTLEATSNQDASILWNGITEGPSLDVSSAGIYQATAVNDANCQGSAQIEITQIEARFLDIPSDFE